ncbi:MAG: YncE family protein [Acidobacteriaceae bacterium]|nr:YncE family protein [Acidobacteriaceae bacterium]
MPSLRWGIAITVFSLSLPIAAQTFKVSDHWKVGGQGGWDYLLSDDANHRLYVTHNSRVEVLDTSSGQHLGAVTGLKSTHGIALNPDGKTAYASDGAGNAIVVFDCVSLKVLQTIPAGTNPDGITFEPATSTVWGFNGHSNNVTVMNAETNQVTATIALPGKPEFPQVDGKGRVFVNIEDKNVIAVLDAKTRRVVTTWSLAGCESPSGMAIDRKKHRLFSVCDGKKMSVIDYDTGKLLGLASIGESPDAAGFDPNSKDAFSSNGDGTLSVVDTSKPGFPTIETVKTMKGARTMAFDASSGRIYLSVAKYGVAPSPMAGNAHSRPPVLPDTFEILVVSK